MSKQAPQSLAWLTDFCSAGSLGSVNSRTKQISAGCFRERGNCSTLNSTAEAIWYAVVHTSHTTPNHRPSSPRTHPPFTSNILQLCRRCETCSASFMWGLLPRLLASEIGSVVHMMCMSSCCCFPRITAMNIRIQIQINHVDVLRCVFLLG